jgi:hypothetical protein
VGERERGERAGERARERESEREQEASRSAREASKTTSWEISWTARPLRRVKRLTPAHPFPASTPSTRRSGALDEARSAEQKHSRTNVLLELDGTIGHFGKDFYGNETRDHALRDLLKERWVLSQGHSVVRVLQTDAWHDRSDWQSYLKQSISAASASSTPKVFCPESAVEHTSGVYAELRAADPGL